MVNLLASFTEVISYAWYILLAVLVLLFMITVHELGHFIAGKLLGFGIEEFSIGFGPKLFQKKKADGELFSVRLLPLGGYCSFLGEDAENADKKAFNNQPPWKRIIVLLAGVTMNYLVSLLLIALMFSFYGQGAIMAYDTINGDVVYETGFTNGDVILKVEGKNVYMSTDLMTAIEGRNAGDEVSFTVVRGGERQEIVVVLSDDTDFVNVEDAEKLSRALGMNYSLGEDGKLIDGGFRTTRYRLSFFEVIGKTFEYSFKLASTVFIVIGQLLRGTLGISSLGGTVTTVALTAEVIKIGGFSYLLNIAALIGVNLALFNILPIPALDGARVLFTVIEWIRKKPLNRKVEAIIHTVGFVLILVFAVFIDLQRCF